MADLPTLKTLFGTMSLCECKDCRSVLSPAAYLVDILQFLSDADRQGLFKRRPDLGEIELTCENSNTPMPYIDLSNEVLENAISRPKDVKGNPLWPQTTWTADELKANTEHVNDDAYSVLAQQVYPWNLPFDLPAEESRVNLGQLGVSRDALMKVFQKRESELPLLDQGDDSAIAGAYLHFTPFEFRIVTGGLAAKKTVRVATSGPINALSGNQKVDFKALADGDRVLVKDQPNLSENGIYTVSTRGAWMRSRDANSEAKVHRGMFVTVKEGDQNANTRWVLTSKDPAKLGLDPLIFARLSEVGEVDAITDQPWNYWGYGQENNIPGIDPRDNKQKSMTWLEWLSLIPVFLKRSGLTHEELLELLSTSFINPDKKNLLIVQFKGGQCNLDTAEFSRQLTTPVLNRIHRFVRLWRKLGWTACELDKAITALRPGDLSDGSLLQMSIIQRLRADLNVPLIEMFSWWANIDTEPADDGVSSLYERLFQNKAVLSLEKDKDVFGLNGDRTELSSTSEHITDHFPGILAGLGIGATDLSLLTDGKVAANALNLKSAEVADDKLNLGNLSRLFRIVSLAKALNLSIRDFLSLKALSGIDCFNPDNVEDTRRFVAMVHKVVGSGFSISELDYLFRHVYQEGASTAPSEQSFVLVLNEIQAGLQKIITDTAGVTDPTGELTKTKLAAIFVDPKLQTQQIETAMAVIDGTSLLNDADREKFIDQNFAVVFGDTTEAKRNLVGKKSLVDKEARFKYVLQAYLRWSLSESFVKQKLGETLKLETAIVEQLLKQVIKSPRPKTDRMSMAEFLDSDFIGNAGKLDVQMIATFKKLHKASMIFGKLKITVDRLGTRENPFWFVKRGPDLGWLDLNALPLDSTTDAKPLFEGWGRLVDLFTLWDKLRPGSSLLGIFDKAPANKNELKDYLDTVSDRTGWGRSDLEDLAGDKSSLGLILPGDYKDERILLRLKLCFDLMRQLGVKADQISDWIKPELTASDAGDIRKTAKAKYDNNQWLAIAKPLRDILREKQRATLVAYLVTHPDLAKGQNWKDTNGLYEYFLIDVEMSSCMTTSRIKQAISSVQLFIQRELMNLETGTLKPKQAKLWTTWMKNYRVWEANRKIFLYPENWIEPELRDDKSPFFKDFENELRQNDLTSDTAETALLHYLEKLDQVARLEICGMYHQQETDEPDNEGKVIVDILHVFGRTRGTPHIYYYRRWIDQAYWTPWEKVDLDIQGDHLIPIIWNRRLYLFWPLFNEKAHAQAVTMPAPNQALWEPTHYWEIQMAWSEHRNGKWLAKKLVPGKLTTDVREIPPPNEIPIPKIQPTELIQEQFVFKAGLDNSLNAEGDLVMQCFHWWSAKTVEHYELGQIRSTASPGISSIANLADYKDRLVNPNNTSIGAQTFEQLLKNNSVVDLSVGTPKNYLADRGTLDLQGATSLMPFRLVYAHQDDQFLSQRPFFYEDRIRTFFVIPEAPVHDLLNSQKGLTLEGFFTDSGKNRYDQNIARDFKDTSRDPSDPIIDNPSYPVNESLNVSTKNTHYRFETYYHPYASLFVRELSRDGIDALLQRPLQREPQDFLNTGEVFDFENVYHPGKGIRISKPLVDPPYPREDVDFSYAGSQAHYNWELFFHAPLMIADHLCKNQRFEDAQKWFHYIFDPTDRSGFQPPQKFWKMRKFFDDTKQGAPQTLQGLMDDAAELKKEVDNWIDNPFNPHLIARMRTVAYQKTVIMKYLDSLISWGDQLFRRDNIEAINEATQLYILAADILGPKPQIIRSPAEPFARMTYNELKKQHLDALANELVDLENIVHVGPNDNGPAESGLEVVLNLKLAPFFCLPPNDKLLGYWSTLADRLFKIRHCMNIEGMARALPLFEPPIDPALLVKAAAAGVDIRSVLSDMNASLPRYRFNAITQKAGELCAEVKALGSAFLSALEKSDAEALALLRSGHEIKVLDAVRQVKEKQIEEAQRTMEGLQKSREIIAIRHDYYTNIAFINSAEKAHLGLANDSLQLQVGHASLNMIASVLRLIPELKTGAPTGMGVTFGGANIAMALSAFADYIGSQASMLSAAGVISATLGGYQRRADDWDLQKRLAAKELDQIDKQIVAAEIRLAIAAQDLQNHELQTDNAKDVDSHMREKFTNQQLYDWMVGQISGIYFQSYQLAYDLAKRAERAYQFELADFGAKFVNFGYWDSLKKGLLAGERLHYDLKRMEAAYLDQNKREYEITKHISLVLTDPIALIALKETGQCIVALPEALLDMDYPGHYMRRIKNVTLTIPCVSGPYTSINCTLTLLTSKIRIDTDDKDYVKDRHFVTNFAVTQSIATSHAQNDSGMFELNFRDERYLPFEGAGVISTWRIEMPKDCNAFDFDTISDVILNLNYTAREGGKVLAEAARKAAILPAHSAQEVTVPAVRLPTQENLLRLFSLKHEFSNEWYRFLNPVSNADKQTLQFDLTQERFPFQFRGRKIEISQIELFLKFKDLNDISKYPKGTPLGDYAAGQPLTIYLTPPKPGNTDKQPLTSETFFMGGLPHSQKLFDFKGQKTGVGSWSLEARAGEGVGDIGKIADTLQDTVKINGSFVHHLKPEVIDDVYMVCHYSVS